MMELKQRYGDDEIGKKVIADVVKGAGSSLAAPPFCVNWPMQGI